MSAPEAAQDGLARRRIAPDLEGILRRAFARPDRLIRGARVPKILQLIEMGLATKSRRGAYDRYTLSPRGEQVAADLTRALLGSDETAQAPPGMSGADGSAPDLSLQRRVEVLARLTDFLASAGPAAGATSLRIDLVGTRQVPRGLRVRVDRCGPSKLLVQVLGDLEPDCSASRTGRPRRAKQATPDQPQAAVEGVDPDLGSARPGSEAD